MLVKQILRVLRGFQSCEEQVFETRGKLNHYTAKNFSGKAAKKNFRRKSSDKDHKTSVMAKNRERNSSLFFQDKAGHLLFYTSYTRI